MQVEREVFSRSHLFQSCVNLRLSWRFISAYSDHSQTSHIPTIGRYLSTSFYSISKLHLHTLNGLNVRRWQYVMLLINVRISSIFHSTYVRIRRKKINNNVENFNTALLWYFLISLLGRDLIYIGDLLCSKTKLYCCWIFISMQRNYYLKNFH